MIGNDLVMHATKLVKIKKFSGLIFDGYVGIIRDAYKTNAYIMLFIFTLGFAGQTSHLEYKEIKKISLTELRLSLIVSVV